MNRWSPSVERWYWHRIGGQGDPPKSSRRRGDDLYALRPPAEGSGPVVLRPRWEPTAAGALTGAIGRRSRRRRSVPTHQARALRSRWDPGTISGQGARCRDTNRDSRSGNHIRAGRSGDPNRHRPALAAAPCRQTTASLTATGVYDRAHWGRPSRGDAVDSGSMAAPDLGTWTPLRLEAVIKRFSPAPFRWWISGGWALDLHLGRSWREHGDTDVGVVRSDLRLVYALLSDWNLHVAAAGHLTPWHGEPLDAALHENNVWCRFAPDNPWMLDVTIGDGSETRWIYRRDTSC